MSENNRPIQRALVSVFHKDGLDLLAQALLQAHTQVVSTGSTAQALASYGVPVTQVSDITGFPESLGGRVKTLDPHIHAGILADMTDPDHVRQLFDLHIQPFDLVIVNLYPFTDTVLSDAQEDEIIEKIDIGGPSMLRGAAKNNATVAVITDPDDYELVAERIRNGQGFSLAERRWLAAKAFAHSAAYDAAIDQWTRTHWTKPTTLTTTTDADTVSTTNQQNDTMASLIDMPTITPTWSRARMLRYGENPHQQAALYVDTYQQGSFAHAQQLGGKPMSYNNYVDADAAWRAVWDFAPQHAVAVVKHNNPCGLAVADNVEQAYQQAHACDPVSAYGGVIATNTTVTLTMAELMRPVFTEVIVAPHYEPEALALLQNKKKNLRILTVGNPPHPTVQYRLIDGGLLIQSADCMDAPGDDPGAWTLVSGQPADTATMDNLLFAWKSIRCVKSNAILLAHNHATVGIGMGQVSRVDACHLAIQRANTLSDHHEERARGAVAASDAFFPFADGAQILINAGIRAIVQPGGSIRDEEVFQAARNANVTMYVTGTRHFLH